MWTRSRRIIGSFERYIAEESSAEIWLNGSKYRPILSVMYTVMMVVNMGHCLEVDYAVSRPTANLQYR